VLVTGRANNDGALAATTTDLAQAFWERRREFDFTTEAHAPETALDVAAAETECPVVIAETGDIPGAGASEDLTDFLEALLDRDDLGQPVLAIVADAASYGACADAGEGGAVDLGLGRRIDADGPLRVSGTVHLLHTNDGINTARVNLGDADVIVADERTNLHRDPEFFAALGYERIDRSAVPPAVKESAEFSELCPDSAVVMHREL
jgi:microcystin degradation protein MlrC